MAKYHVTAARLKPLIEQCNFTEQQMNVILRIAGGCSQLRGRKVIESYVQCLLPEKYELKYGAEREAKSFRGGTYKYRPAYVAEVGKPFVEPVAAVTVEEAEEE